MKANQIRVGGVYIAKVNNKLQKVRVDRIMDQTSYNGRASKSYAVTNLATGRTTTFRSAAKFRSEVVNTPEGHRQANIQTGRKVSQDEIDRVNVEASGCVIDPITANLVSVEDEQRADPQLDGVALSADVEGNRGNTSHASDDVEGEDCTDPHVMSEMSHVNGVVSATINATAPKQSLDPVTPVNRPTSGFASKFANGLGQRAKPSATHLEVSALAGTGKSTTAVQGLIAAKGGKPSITPSAQQSEIWDSLKLGKLDSVRISSFNASITNEMKDKIEKAGLLNKGVEARGVHSLGLQAVTKAYGRLKVEQYAVQDAVAHLLGGNPRDLRKLPGMATVLKATDELVSLCKQTLTEPTIDNLDELCSRYDVETNGQVNRIYELVPEILELGKNPSGMITFDDMVYLPVVNNLPVYRVDTQIVDECQDLNRMQQELIYKVGHRIIYVGDRNQAICGFAGADSTSMDRMKDHLTASVLPLTMTRRCGKAIVREAQRYVPEFEAHESNCEGYIGDARWPWQGKAEERRRLPWGESYGPLVQQGALVLCRVNAPIVSECFSFLKQGIKATILGRKIGQGLISTIEKSKAERVVNLIAWLDDWLAEEMAKEQAKRNPSEGRIQNLQDRVDCITTFCTGCQHTSDVTRKINEVFADKQCPKCRKGHPVEARVCDVCTGGVELILPPGVRFSSIHKSKGLEADQVFYLQPPNMGPREDKMQDWELQQEVNLRYVATTRAIRELYYVR